jgi:hypothetical protein
MSEQLEFSDRAAENFRLWLTQVAKPAVAIETIYAEMLSVIDKKLVNGQDLSYELGVSNTLSARPEVFHLTRSDLVGGWLR